MKDIAIEIFYERHSDGRYYIKSLDVPGLHLSGMDFEELQADLDPVVKKLMFHNMGFTVESVTWVPSPAEAKEMLARPQAGRATYIARVKAAA